MKLSYNVTGQERKSLVGAISTILNSPTKYLGAPTFAYEVGNYHIDKVGMLTGPDNLDLEDALHQAGFDADGGTRKYDEPNTYESGLGGMGALDEFPDIDQHHPGRYADPKFPFTPEMQKQIDDHFLSLPMTNEEELGLGRTRRENFQGENGMRANDVPQLDNLVVEMPLTGFTPEKFDNLIKLVNAKAPLLKAALGAEELPIRQTADSLSFPWFSGGLDGDMVKAYATLIEKICKAAKEKHRVTAKGRDVENPKYAMRCWLLSLGFIGDEYKLERKILLRNLSGNSAFKDGQKKGFSREELDTAKADPAVRAEINAILGGNEDEQ